jgi:hypothetical protein
VTTTAQPGALGELQLAAIAGLEHLEIGLIVAIETDVVPVMTAVPHDNIRVFLRDDNVMILIDAQGWRFSLFVAAIAIKVGKVGFGCDKLSIGDARCRIAGERRVHQWNVGQRGSVPPEIRDKGSRQRQEAQRQPQQNRRSFGLSLHLSLEQSCQMRPILAQRELLKA